MEEERRPGIWRGDPPASEAAIQKLLNDCGFRLPEAYLSQLRQSNGGEGDLAVDPGWVSFWPAEEVIDLNKGYEVSEYLPGFFGFGSNGGGELLAFKINEIGRWPVYMIPFIPMGEEHARRIAKDFEEFGGAVGYELIVTD
jgi:hypothetical protein